MFLCALKAYAVAIIISVVAVQYAFALFCLLKLAYLDITKKEYVLWNLFILLVFFIGGMVFLIYRSKVKGEKTIPPYTPPAADAKGEGEGEAQAETAEPEPQTAPEPDEAAKDTPDDGPTEAATDDENKI